MLVGSEKVPGLQKGKSGCGRGRGGGGGRGVL